MTHKRSIRVHLVENDRPLKMLLERRLEEAGPTVVAVHSGSVASDLFHQQHCDRQLDFELPGLGRIETRRRHSSTEEADFVMLGQGVTGTEIDLADFEADFGRDTGRYPFEFLTKPLTTSDLGNIALEVEARKRQQRTGDNPPQASSDIVLGRSPRMQELMQLAHRVAAGSASVLVQGETGTGKTVLARQIHAASPRADRRFVAINCSAFQDQLLESELFGHEKGSFTGANAAKPGLFEMAHQGTLFLDEVGDMTSAMQAKLLQILDDGELRRVGGTKVRKVDVRIVAASNKDLQAEVREGRFREDLFFRLNVIRLHVPRLTERREDIPPLVDHFLARFQLPGRAAKRISPEALKVLMSYAWPGNVRELANTLEGLTLLAPGDEIRLEDLPSNLRAGNEMPVDESGEPAPLSEMEKIHIARTLRFTEGRKAPAARLLGIDVKTLRSKIRLYEIAEQD